MGSNVNNNLQGGKMELTSVIDRGELLIRIDDDMELLGELIELFLEDYPQLMTEIEQGIAAQDAFILKRSAHTLKGSVGNFCANAAFQAAFELEQAGSAGDFTDADRKLANLKLQMARVEESLKSLAHECTSD